MVREIAAAHHLQAEAEKSSADDRQLGDEGELAGEEAPLGGYAVLMGLYSLGLVAALHRVEGRDCSELSNISARDFLLLALATHKLSRILSKDWVTTPLRAPFAEFVESAGAGEVREAPRGVGLQKAVGELLTCPLCLAPWVGGALAFGLILRPKTTRLVTNTFAAVAVSDFLQHAYVAVREATEG